MSAKQEVKFDLHSHVRALEWFATKICQLEIALEGECSCGKSYDPLTIDFRPDGSGTAHSYAFDFKDGGRNHEFESLYDLEQWLVDEMISVAKGLEGDGS